MEIVAKSKFNQNIYDKLRKGAKAIEIHLDEDFINNPIPWDEQIIKDANIVAVHAPLLYGENDTNIEVFDNRKTLVKTCDFARMIADAQGHSVTVVCHLGTDPDAIKNFGVYENLVFFMRDLADAYEQLVFVVENVTPFDSKTANLNGHIGFRKVDFDSSVRFVKDVSHPRVGTCLDTCHALMTIALKKYVTPYIYGEEREVECESLETFFKANKDVIKWVHLANTKSNGLGSDHGLPFTENDLDDLKEIIDLYNKYGYNCPIVLEVRESDYKDAQNYLMTYNMLLKVI